MSKLRGRTGSPEKDQARQPFVQSNISSRSNFVRRPGLTEQPRLKKRPAYLLGRSPLKSFYYTKGARGKWHTADRVLLGMRWNHYLCSGDAIPKGAMPHPPRIPPVVKGLLTSIRTQRQKELVLQETPKAKEPPHKNKTMLAEMRPFVVRSSRSRAARIDVNVPPQDVQQIWPMQEMPALMPFEVTTHPVNDVPARADNIVTGMTAVTDEIPTAFVSMEVQNSPPRKAARLPAVQRLQYVVQKNQIPTAENLQPVVQNQEAPVLAMPEEPRPAHIRDEPIENVGISIQQDAAPPSIIEVVPEQVAPLPEHMVLELPGPMKIMHSRSPQAAAPSKRPTTHRTGLAPAFRAKAANREEIITDALPFSEIRIGTPFGFNVPADVQPTEIRLQETRVGRHIGYIPTVRKRVRQLKVAQGAEAVPPQ
jgi:hypothetical protein